MKKNVSLVGAALMALSLTLAACGGKKADTTPTAPEAPAEAPAEGTENPCGGATENPCGGATENPCGGGNPCGG
jgi:hypothetical protein